MRRKTSHTVVQFLHEIATNRKKQPGQSRLETFFFHLRFIAQNLMCFSTSNLVRMQNMIQAFLFVGMEALNGGRRCLNSMCRVKQCDQKSARKSKRVNKSDREGEKLKETGQ